jgi:hypothetical protein
VGVDDGAGLGVTEGVLGVLVGGIGVQLGMDVLVGTVVFVGQDVWDGGGVVVDDGVIDGVQVMVGVLVGSGVLLGSGVFDGSGVLVGGGGGDGVGVVVAVAVAVQVTIDRGTTFLTSWQPFWKSMIKPKSEFWTPLKGPPPPQSLSKSISHLLLEPASKLRLPLQIVDES